MLESGVAFSHHGGKYCQASTGQKFEAKHLHVARAIRKLKTIAKLKLKSDQVKAEVESGCQVSPSV